MGLPDGESSTSASTSLREGRDSSHQNQPLQLTDSHPWGEPLRQLPRPTRPRPAAPMEHLLKKAKNCVTLHSLRLEVDEQNPDYHLISFVFYARYDGSFTICYFGKKVEFPFQKGPGQKFRQPSGTGIDLGFFLLEELSTPPSSREDLFPLEISAATFVPSSTLCTQVIQAVIDKNNDKNAFDVRVIEQTFYIDGFSLKWEEIRGITNSTAKSLKDRVSGICEICYDKPNDTCVLPCRHMEMCGECLGRWKLENNTCPLCREPIEKLVSIKNIDQR